MREAEEETGLKIKARKLVAVTNDVFESDKKHYITLFAWCEATDSSAEPQVSLFSLIPQLMVIDHGRGAN